MRKDMAKVVTEAPRRGHRNPSRKWGRRLTKDEYEADDHGPSRAPIARRHQYGWNPKEFSDVLGPLRRYLRKQVGRPWDKVWSEITATLDSRSLTGQHIFDHIAWEVEQHAWISDGCVYGKRWWDVAAPVEGLYVHPETRLLCHAERRDTRYRGGPFLEARARLRAFGISAESRADIDRYRVDGLRLWERRDCGWFIHTYRRVPDRLIYVLTRSDGVEVPIYCPAGIVRVATKQASKKEVRDARPILEQDPLAPK